MHTDLDARGQRWERLIFDRCRFGDTTTQHERSAFISCAFRETSLLSALFTGRKLSASVFDGAALAAVRFVGGDLSSVSLGNSVLSGLDLSGVKLYGANLGTDFSGSDLTRAGLRNTRLQGANFVNTDLRGALLDDLDPRQVDLSRNSDHYGCKRRGWQDGRVTERSERTIGVGLRRPVVAKRDRP